MTGTDEPSQPAQPAPTGDSPSLTSGNADATPAAATASHTASVAAGGSVAGEEHHPFQAHHFATMEQQHDSGKFGMWVFLATEVLLFAGLFCAYAVYRALNPETFHVAHHVLDTKWGAINTVVLLFSSLTMAMGVRYAQLGKKGPLIASLIVTIMCACGFLGIKYIEYEEKISHHITWGTEFKYSEFEHKLETKLGGEHGEHGEGDHADDNASHDTDGADHGDHNDAAGNTHDTDGDEHADGNEAAGNTAAENPPAPSGSQIARAPSGPTGMNEQQGEHMPEEIPNNVHLFFGIYFVMTGLHGLHVIIGMSAIIWILLRAFKGHFGPKYYTPVDLVGLYWHLVDLIWIFLFPLLYLID